MDNVLFDQLDRSNGLGEAAARSHAEELDKIRDSEQLQKKGQAKSGRNRMDKRPSNIGRNAVVVAGGMLTAGAIAISHGGGLKAESYSNPNEGIKIGATSQVPESSVQIGSEEPKDFEKSDLNTQAVESHTPREKIDPILIQVLLDRAPSGVKKNAEESIPLVVQTLNAVGLNSPEAIAYTFASMEPESSLDLEKTEVDPVGQAAKFHYDGGALYAGRGGLNLTGKGTYREATDWLHKYASEFSKIAIPGHPEYFKDLASIDLVINPGLASRMDISAAITASFMKEKGVIDAVNQKNFRKAREIVNGHFDDDSTYNMQIMRYVNERMGDYLKAMETREYMLAATAAQLDRLLSQ